MHRAGTLDGLKALEEYILLIEEMGLTQCVYAGIIANIDALRFWLRGNRSLRWREKAVNADGRKRENAGMEDRERLIQLKESSGMNWKEFAEYFEIPYRTMQDWEHGKRSMPHYLLRLMEYKMRMEKLGGGHKSK